MLSYYKYLYLSLIIAILSLCCLYNEFLSKDRMEKERNFYFNVQKFYILQFIPLPSVAGFYLARFFTKKSLPSYFAFVVLGSLMVMWFVLNN